MKKMVDKAWVAGTPRLWTRSVLGTRQCPGCLGPLVERILAEVIEEMGIEGDVIGLSSIGCTGMFHLTLQVDAMKVCHGRAPDVATGIKHALFGRPVVFTIQGDGDCLAIGGGSLLGAVSRAERITVILVNNTIFGMTGGQLAPTTLMGQETTTTPTGRGPQSGYPLHACEMLTPIKGVAYCARGTVHTPANYQRSKTYIKRAFQKQLDNVGFSFVEILIGCPTLWHVTPAESLKWIEEKMVPEFPLGEFKNVDSID